jgi:SAM-dependent methyltransferase
MQNFCELYPRFLETSETVPSRNRLDSRWRAIIAWNEAFLAGRRILDLGCHDGRWSFAALKAGASHVIGVEARAHLVEKASENLRFYDTPTDSYELVNGDAVEVMRDMKAGSVDVVLCLGFFYHTLEHMRVLLETRRIGAEVVILDTSISASDEPIIALHFESVHDNRNSIDYGKTGNRDILVGAPSRSGLIAMLDYTGYGVEFFDWRDNGVDDWGDLPDYAADLRVTARATRRSAGLSPG